MEQQTDLFGEAVIKDELLRDKFIEPPFSILDTKQGTWQARKKKWIAKGLKSEVGRDVVVLPGGDNTPSYMPQMASGTSIFNPALCEVMYHWFCDPGAEILDVFAGGSVRGVVANYLGYKYTGIELREEQVTSNREQALEIVPINNQPQWYVGDSETKLDEFNGKQFDMLFSCPPYADLEVYSDHPDDLSNMPYEDFLAKYERIIAKTFPLLKAGAFAVFVVGEVRDTKTEDRPYLGFVPDTIKAFTKAGYQYYNEAILLDPIGTAMIRASRTMRTGKLVKVHQNVLIFRKPRK